MRTKMNDGDNVNDDDGHDDEYKPYSCLQCDLSFKMTKDLKMHMIQHGGKKSHSCNLCGYSTTSASKLKRHMLWFTEANPAWL